jgi:hypothetical protein
VRKKLAKNDRWITAIGGAISAIVVWLILELLFAAEPSLFSALLGGIGFGFAWIAGTFFLRRQFEQESTDEG